MSEAKFTPGPWHVRKPDHGSQTRYKCVQIGADDMYSTLELLPEDARLIAAAPDLFHALCGLVSYLEEYCQEKRFKSPEYKAAKEAIAKAVRKQRRSKATT